MRQVPEHLDSLPFLIIGNGRLAKHILNYFEYLGVDYSHWYRQNPIKLSQILNKDYKILILINDDSIESFIEQNLLHKKENSFLIHCSGSLISKYAVGAHPLMTFAESLYEKEIYQSIPFIIDSDQFLLSDIFPEFVNPSYFIPFDKKALYHVWCSMAGNFTSILWMNLFSTFQKEFNLDKNVAGPYLTQICKNLLIEEDPLTGPLIRGDIQTIENHLKTLTGNPFKEIYEAFIKVYNENTTVKL